MEISEVVKNRKAQRAAGSSADVKNYALKLLSYRARSKNEMFQRLERKGFDRAHIDNTIAFLERTGLINDRALAADLLKHSIERRPLGKKGIREYLLKRGIDKDFTDKILLNHTPEAEYESASNLVEKKLLTLQHYPRDVVKRRLWGMLQRRGFSYETIKKVINSITKSE